MTTRGNENTDIVPAGDDRDGCGACSLAGRRAFLRDAGLALAALVSLGVRPELASAFSVHAVSPLSSGAEERRYAIPAANGVQVDEDAGVMLARVDRAVYALSLSCPHQRTALEWRAARGQFHCPKHRSAFRADGALIGGRAKRSLDRFAVRRDGEVVVVRLDQLLRADRDEAAWASAVVML